MADDFEKKLLAGAAYRIFHEELFKHLAATELFMQALGTGCEQSSDQLREASGRYHTIRGGAGFFQFTRIAALAGELETKIGESSSGLIVAQLQTLCDLDAELRREAAALPAPAPAA
jgi:chemotaxis protein histidine kinase CheA